MKKVVKRYLEVWSMLQESDKQYDYGEVFETGSGAFAVIWKDYPMVTVILPEEFELNEWGDLIDPFSVAREDDTHPLLTESNLRFDGKPVFNWCKIAENQDGRIWLQLCEPKDATHMFIYGFRKASGIPLASDDEGKLCLCDYYHEGKHRSTLILPVGYIRLSYQAGCAEDHVLRFTYGADGKMLQEHFALRAKEPRAKAQEKLDTQRSEREERAREVAATRQFIADHAEELDDLQKRRNTLASRARLLRAEFSHDGDQFTSKIWTDIDKTSVNGMRMWGYGQAFEFSQEGIKELSELIESKSSILKDRLERQQQQEDDQREKELRAKMLQICKAVAKRHIRVYMYAGEGLYLCHEHGNYRSIGLVFDPCLFELYVESKSSSAERYDVTDEDCQEAILKEIDSSIKHSGEHIRKLRFWIWDIIHANSQHD